MSMKDNFSQAFKELLKRDDSIEGEMDGVYANGASSAPAAPASFAAKDTFSAGRASQEHADSASGETDEYEEVTVISRNTTISGDIRSFANVGIEGSVKGDVETTQNIDVSGSIEGNIAAKDILLRGASVQGNIASQGSIVMDKNSLLVGDISAQNMALNGKLKGNLEIGQSVVLKPNAIVLGNVTVASISIEQGARLQGYVNTAFPKEQSGGVFAPAAQPLQEEPAFDFEEAAPPTAE